LNVASPEASFITFEGSGGRRSIFRPEGPVRRTHWRFTWTSSLTAAFGRRALAVPGLALVRPRYSPLGHSRRLCRFSPSRQPRRPVPSALSVLLRVLLTSARIAKSVTAVTVRR